MPLYFFSLSFNAFSALACFVMSRNTMTLPAILFPDITRGLRYSLNNLSSGSGKVMVGQKVNIKLDNYPHLEFGILQGKITNMSLVPVSTGEGNFYTAEVRLNQGLVTNYQRTLPFSQEMQGNAEIITDDRRLLMRMVAPLVSLYRERMLTD